MATKLKPYLHYIKVHSKLDPSSRNQVLQELLAHLEDRKEELKKKGLSEEEAIETVSSFFGSPQLVAQQIYEVYNQGSWKQAFFAALPHLLFALLFALRWWNNIVCLTAALILILGVVIYGWWHGKPSWLFSWLGYYLLPVIIAGALLISLPGNWVWLAVAIYFPLALYALFSLAKKTAEQDWLYTSLMLFPIPLLLAWLLALGGREGLLINSREIYDFAPWIATTFLILALITTTFVRLKQRWIKMGAILAPAVLILAPVGLVSQNNLGIGAWFLIALASLLFLLSPILLESKEELKE